MYYRAVIVDDEEIHVALLRNSLKRLKNISVSGTATNVEAGVKIILKEQPDIIFIDIELEESNGFDLIHQIKDKASWYIHIVIYSSYEKYLIDALRLPAHDFLKKPYSKNDFGIVINRFFDHYKEPNDGISSVSRIESLTSKPFLIPSVMGFEVLYSKEIVYFEYNPQLKQWDAVLSNREVVKLKRNTSAHKLLSFDETFIQVNQNQIINICYLARIEGNQCVFRPPLNDMKTITISRLYFKQIQQLEMN